MSKSEGQVLDFEKICRLCLLEKRSMSSIFAKKKSDKKVPLPVRIMSCASLELYEGDGLPASICSKCLLSVNQSYAFREQCEQADTTLRQYAQRMNEASGETSSNREPRELIANDSLEHIEDIEINIEEANGVQDVDFKRRDNLDLNSEKVLISSDQSKKNLQLNENEAFSLRKKCSDFMSSTKEKEEQEKPVVDCKADLSESTEVDDRRLKRRVFSSVNGKMKKKKKKQMFDERDFGSKKTNSFRSPLLKALSEEKAENLVVVADVPRILDDEDRDFCEKRSEDEDTSIKSETQKWFRHGLRSRKGLSSSQKCLLKRSPPAKSNFENKKHLELLQNLMKNKSIIIQKRGGACVPSNCLTKKELPLKYQELNKTLTLRRTKALTFSEDFKMSHLWKEWEEVNRRVTKVSKTERVKPTFLRINDIVNETDGRDGEFKGECLGSHKNEGRIESTLIQEELKSDENPKIKWKNAKDTVYCEDCRIFLLRSSYNNHIKFVHKKIRKYLCQICGYAACTGTILRQHVQAVHIGYSFFCDQCPKKFNLMKRLRKHVELQHSGKPVERNHVCQYCGMAFVKPGCLKRHLRSHTQETPYQCQYCQRRFKYRWPKVQHERLHTGEKPYKCSFCEERFTQNCVRKAHEYKKHGNEEFKPKIRVKEEKPMSKSFEEEKEDSEASQESCDSGAESN